MGDTQSNGTSAASEATDQRSTSGDQTQQQAQQQAQASASGETTSEQQAQQQTQQQGEILNPAAKAAADEAARYRTQLRDAQKRIADFESAQQAADLAKLSETERLQKQLADAQAREAQQTLAAQERITRAEVRAEATRMGINPQLAARIVDYAAIEYDDSGDPTNIGDLLGAAISAYGLNPQPAAGAAQATAAAQAAALAQQVGATNAQRANGPLVINATQYSDPAFRTQFMRDYGEDILTALTKGRAKLV